MARSGISASVVRRHGLRALAALVTSALISLISAHGHAYCLTRTCDPKSGSCEFDELGCNLSGNALFWASSCVTFHVQRDGSKKLQIDASTLEQATVKAFQQWTSTDCGNGTFPNIQLIDGGKVSCAKPEYNQSQPNANIVTFHDSTWTHTNAQETVALTSVHFDTQSGEIYDADVEMNSDRYDFVDGNPVGAQIDLNAALTHEAGHFLGLSHSAVTEATMYWEYSDSAALLTEDDVLAICAAIPPDRTPTSDDCTPRHGFSSECANPDSGCCSTAIGKGASRDQATLALLAFAVGLCAWRSRLYARRTRRPRSHRSR